MTSEELKISPDYKLIQRKISSLEYTIQALNRWGIEKHNQHDVLDKVMRIEERKRVRGIEIDKTNLTPEEKQWVAEGMDPECVYFLQKNFLARPKQALDWDKPLLDIPQHIKDMYRQYRRDTIARQPSDIPDDYIRIFKMYDKSSELQSLFRDASPELRNVFNKYKKILAPHYRCVINDTKRFGIEKYAIPQMQSER